MSTRANRRALTLVCLMILATWTPLATIPTASAHGGIMAEWGGEGSNDTGWMRMDATGANPATAQMAMSNLMVDFAPGAEISNWIMPGRSERNPKLIRRINKSNYAAKHNQYA